MILVDSDILIAHLRGVAAAGEWLESTVREHGRPAISVTSLIEIRGGMRSAERHQVSRLLSEMRVVAVNERIAYRAAEFMRTYRRSHGAIGLADFMIAGTAAVEGLELKTLNLRHFPMFPDLERPFDLPG